MLLPQVPNILLILRLDSQRGTFTTRHLLLNTTRLIILWTVTLELLGGHLPAPRQFLPLLMVARRGPRTTLSQHRRATIAATTGLLATIGLTTSLQRRIHLAPVQALTLPILRASIALLCQRTT